MARWGWCVLLLTACSGSKSPEDLDSDNDGILDSEELALGLDPNKADSDGDGLDDPDEIDLGTNPLSEDTDADGLLDPEEAGFGTDPLLFDTDNDTYGDGLELDEGLDPLDRKDRFYEGFWPFNPNKDSMVDPGWDGEPLEEGETFGRLTNLVDQYGETVDIYDFAGTGKYVVIDASATWCESCIKTASWLSGGPDQYQFEVLFAHMRVALNEGQFHWVTFMTDDGSGTAEPQDVANWHEAFPNDKIAVLTDPDEHVLLALNQGTTYSGVDYSYFPSFLVLDSDMNVVMRGLVWDALNYLDMNLPDEE